MPSRRLNVLVYAGTGTTVESVRHATWSLRRLLGSNYAVVTVTTDQILKEPWMASCAMLVVPGGADVGYCRALDGAGNRLIKQYVQMGGTYLGLCAGGYYGSAACEWEIGRPGMEVVGPRELAFFPGTCRGLAFPGFQYHSETGARAAELAVTADGSTSFRAYYNGGGVFVDAEKYRDRGVEILASYAEPLAVEVGQGTAAVVYCKVGKGAAILTGPHPEFSGSNLTADDPNAPSHYRDTVAALIADDGPRILFMKACLTKLGLTISDDEHDTPSLSQLHLSAVDPVEVRDLVAMLTEKNVIIEHDDRQAIKGENDTFIIRKQSGTTWDMSLLEAAVPTDAAVGLVDYHAVVKSILIHDVDSPGLKETGHFNHQAYFSSLQTYHKKLRNGEALFGRTLLYGEVITSTSTMLEKNTTLLSHLPIGFTATATTQVAARGRGSNVWISPPGQLMFSTVMRHPMQLSTKAPVVFVQYLAALAVVAGVRDYDRGYDKLEVKLKWPNDIYALDPDSDQGYVKIAGILVSSSYAGGDYTCVTGIGLNVNNKAPTTSLSKLASKAGLPALSLERLLASILAHFESLYTGFCISGFDGELLKLYYSSWLHSNQIVTLEMEGGAKARIKGITQDWGLLVAEELGWEDRPTGRTFQLQSDSNSFDFFKGLLKRKLQTTSLYQQSLLTHQQTTSPHITSVNMPKETKTTRGAAKKAGKADGGRKKKDPNQPKRGLSAYMFFANEQRDKVRDENPGIKFGEVGKMLGHKWKDLSDKQKAPYESKAAADKKRYEEEKAAYTSGAAADDEDDE